MLRLGLELESGLEQGPELELELVAVEAGTGCLASKAGRAVLELGLWLWLVQELVLWLAPELGLKLVQGQRRELAVSQASRACLAVQSSTVQAGWAVLATQGTQLQAAAEWAKGY